MVASALVIIDRIFAKYAYHDDADRGQTSRHHWQQQNLIGFPTDSQRPTDYDGAQHRADASQSLRVTASRRADLSRVKFRYQGAQGRPGAECNDSDRKRRSIEQRHVRSGSGENRADRGDQSIASRQGYM